MSRVKTRTIINQARLAALEDVRKKNKRKILIAQEVVNAAKDKGNPLHACFEWDNDVAADEWRLHQARHLISIAVTIVDTPQGSVTVPAYLSLPNDRKQPSGGYRSTEDVIRQKTLRRELLQGAVRDFRSVKERYERITDLVEELRPVFDEIDALAEKVGVEKKTA